MPNKLEQFLCAVDDNNVDKALLSESVVKNTLNSIENFGKDLGESVENFFQSTKKTPPSKPSTPTPTYSESAFLEPKHETTLYDVTNKKHEVPEVTKSSNIFKKLSYSFRGFTASVDYKQDDSKYRVFAGEKIGLGYETRNNSTETAFSALFNVKNGKSTLNYSSRNKRETYGVSLFNKNGVSGASAFYSLGEVRSSISVDKNSSSLNCSLTKKSDDCSVELNTYITTGDNYSNPYAGIGGRVTF